ncbi:hypothetical protein DL96DRAFT_1684899 [Flagelloscypha sp. PMI_526]|nr:hypothetical protein DL96DRAFT_1684899 [Flagelloscypha sp. PMI_526]
MGSRRGIVVVDNENWYPRFFTAGQIVKAKEKQHPPLPEDALFTKARLDTLLSTLSFDSGSAEDSDHHNFATIDSITSGTDSSELVNGYELEQVSEEMGSRLYLGGLFSTHGRRKRIDWRTRRDVVERRTLGFDLQREAFAHAFSISETRRLGYGDFSESMEVGTRSIKLFSSTGHIADFPAKLFNNGYSFSISLVAQGLIPPAPYNPSRAFKVETMELFHRLTCEQPKLTAYNFVRALCHRHGTPFQSSVCAQFRVAYDVYVWLLWLSKAKVLAFLGRNGKEERMKNTCPASTSTERPDSREVLGDYFLRREDVDKWEIGLWEKAGEDIEYDVDPCEEKWKNMDPEKTAKAWGIFEENSLFLCLCRHGFVLAACDIVRSSEKSKYPLAITSRLLEAFEGKSLGIGYDIGCQFRKTLMRSPLGSKAASSGYQSHVGLFHAYAHSRKCQLNHLPRYRLGVGLEDFEGCERFFSKSNGLASKTRHANPFHRQQAISLHMEHNDTYVAFAHLSRFIYNNYVEVDKLMKDEDDFAVDLERRGLTRADLEKWHEEEKTYLSQLAATQPENANEAEAEYVSTLERWWAAKAAVEDAETAMLHLPPNPPKGNRSAYQRVWNKRRQALDNESQLRSQLFTLESALGLTKRWTQSNAEWVAAKGRAELRDYRLKLDALEKLVVQRIAELEKMNLAETGYALRKKIGTALKARSAAIRKSLEQLNEAGSRLYPPRCPLQWDEVVEFGFLAKFDTLRGSSGEIGSRAWSSPGSRELVDRHFKYLRAHEERERLNIEITRLITYIYEECAVYEEAVEQARTNHPLLVFAIEREFAERGRFFNDHLTQLKKLSSLRFFSGSLKRSWSSSSHGRLPVPPISPKALSRLSRCGSAAFDAAPLNLSDVHAECILDDEDAELEETVANAVIAVISTAEDH